MTNAATKKPRRGAGRVAFLARFDKFKQLINAGYEQRTVYDNYESELGISYSQFNRYVIRYIGAHKADGYQKKGQQGQTTSQNLAKAPIGVDRAACRTADPALSTTDKPEKRALFVHNPSSGNDRDDLI